MESMEEALVVVILVNQYWLQSFLEQVKAYIELLVLHTGREATGSGPFDGWQRLLSVLFGSDENLKERRREFRRRNAFAALPPGPSVLG